MAATGRRGILTLAAAAALDACAAEPNSDAYLARNGNDPLQRHYALQRSLHDGPLVSGNRTHLLIDGRQALPAMFRSMQQARDHINLEYYELEDVAVGRTRLSNLLIGKLNQGVAVNIIHDAFGCRETPAEMFDALRRAGAAVVAFNPVNPVTALTGEMNDRDHRKIMVIDGRIGFVGGINLTRSYENPRSAGVPLDGDVANAYWRDAAMGIRGPAVADLQRLFFATWQQQKGEAVKPAHYFPIIRREGAQTIRIIGSAPGDRHPLYYVSLIEAIRAARQRIFLSSGYFVPPHQEREELARAARRGVELRLLVPSHSDVMDAVYAGRAAYGDLLEAGAQIFERQDAVLHAKLTVIDGVWTSIGSSNLDRRSVIFNNEVDAIILGADTAGQVERLLRRDTAVSPSITLQAWRERPVRERLNEFGARLWEYWM